jgi:transposase-like protein
VTDAAPVYPGVLDEMVPSAWHHVEQYANNPVEADHGQLKRRLKPMRASKRTGQHRMLSPGMPSCRICAAATTNSESMSAPHCGSPPRLPNLPTRSDERVRPAQRVC